MALNMHIPRKLKSLAFISLLTQAATVFGADFAVTMRDQNGNSQQVSCAKEANQARYGTQTRTTAQEDYWTCRDDKACGSNMWQLKFSSIKKGTAYGGRCTTPVSNLISGDGVFSARLLIDSSVSNSAGVFTIAILSWPYNRKEELDLVVINLQDNIVKFGVPSRSVSVDMSKIINQWITVSMDKKGDVCHLVIQREKQEPLDLGNIYCNFNPERNRIVVNARARKAANADTGFITVSSVQWEKR